MKLRLERRINNTTSPTISRTQHNTAATTPMIRPIDESSGELIGTAAFATVVEPDELMSLVVISMLFENNYSYVEYKK